MLSLRFSLFSFVLKDMCFFFFSRGLFWVKVGCLSRGGSLFLISNVTGVYDAGPLRLLCYIVLMILIND